jgi:hypothetical protein
MMLLGSTNIAQSLRVGSGEGGVKLERCLRRDDVIYEALFFTIVTAGNRQG